MWPIQIVFPLFIICGIFLSSLTFCNTYQFLPTTCLPFQTYRTDLPHYKRCILSLCQVICIVQLPGLLFWAICSKRHHSLILGTVTSFILYDSCTKIFCSFLYFFITFLSQIKMLMTEIAFISSYKTKPCRSAPCYFARDTTYVLNRFERQGIINGCVLTVTHFRLFLFLLSCPLIVDSRGIELHITPCIRIFCPSPLQHPG